MTDSRLLLRRTDPPNFETRLDLHHELLTPNHAFYLRNNFPPPSSWPGLTVGGEVERPIEEVDLGRYQARKLVATLECAGNGRAFLQPPAPGEQWELGAVSTAEWEGVSLADVLMDAGVREGSVEVLFSAGDGFQRSLPVETALSPTTMLVQRMNGEPLPREHGGPLRALVPGWYGMAAVKWLTRVEPISRPFEGHFQVEKYVVEGRPVREMAVRSVITGAAPGEVRGYAWSGRGSIVRVELSADQGGSWSEARLGASAPPYGWTEWLVRWKPAGPGEHLLISRATDSTGRTQPLEQSWNELGYANNAAQPVTVRVE